MAGIIKKMIPLFDRIVVQKAEQVVKTDAGIVLPEQARDPVLRAKVIAVGPGERNESGKYIVPQIKVGDEVLLPDYGGTKVKMEKHGDVYLYKESNILAKIE